MSAYQSKKFIIGKNAKYYTSIHYALIPNINNWICAYRPQLQYDVDTEERFFTEWAQGHYFDNKENAETYIRCKLSDYINDLAIDIEEVSKQIITLISDLI